MEMDKSRSDKSMRALPQLSPSDFIMMGLSSCTEYVDSLMTIYKENISYTINIQENSAFYKAYDVVIEALIHATPMSDFFNESLFDFDVSYYIKGLLDPDKLQDIMVPVPTNSK